MIIRKKPEHCEKCKQQGYRIQYCFFFTVTGKSIFGEKVRISSEYGEIREKENKDI